MLMLLPAPLEWKSGGNCKLSKSPIDCEVGDGLGTACGCNHDLVVGGFRCDAEASRATLDVYVSQAHAIKNCHERPNIPPCPSGGTQPEWWNSVYVMSGGK